jgi:hypothetical protein
VLRAFKRGELSIEQLVEADANGKLKSRALLAEISLRAELWTAIDAALPKWGRESRRAGATSRRSRSCARAARSGCR